MIISAHHIGYLFYFILYLIFLHTIYFYIIIYKMFRVFVSKNPIFKFSTKSFDVAVIGGGPGGNSFSIKGMLQQLKLLS